MKILFLGDIVGRIGRRALKDNLRTIIRNSSIDLVIANGENSAGGLGIDPKTAGEIYAAGADFITTGNHIWNKKDIIKYLELNKTRIIRPANYKQGAAGVGFSVFKKKGLPSIGIANLMGRVFIDELLECPFAKADLILKEFEGLEYTFLDFHAETTSETVSMGFHVDGRFTMMVGTHTHVQTADLRILPKGTGYITDAGMCGAYDSVIGMKPEPIVERFKTGLPTRFEPAKGRAQINGVIFECENGKVVGLERVLEVYE